MTDQNKPTDKIYLVMEPYDDVCSSVAQVFSTNELAKHFIRLFPKDGFYIDERHIDDFGYEKLVVEREKGKRMFWCRIEKDGTFRTFNEITGYNKYALEYPKCKKGSDLFLKDGIFFHCYAESEKQAKEMALAKCREVFKEQDENN